ncbi:MAG: acetylornithine transaminase [Clostridia bacterium]|nr:acetylornithine transaminase [Clostridia bacterium]
MNITELDSKYIAKTYNRFPLEFVKGKGSVLTDTDGKDYIDMGSGIGVNIFGIGDDGWKNAVLEQLDKLQHTSNLYYTEPCVMLAEKLCQKTGFKKVFFSNSGAEANECAIKVARKYAAENKGEDCYTIVTIKNSFHGRTLTTLAASGQEHYHELYKPLTDGFVSVEAENKDELINLSKTTKIAAVLAECIQGEGGVISLSKEYLKFLREWTEKNDVLLIIDEVQTGNGRTGKLYSYMNYGFTPDIVSTAKGLGGGLPIGATLLSEKVKDVFGFGDHGSTFGGNPISCAAANYVIDKLDDNFLKNVSEKAKILTDVFKSCEDIAEISGMGLMIGLKPKSKTAGEVVNECIKNGVLCLTAKDKVRLLPPLNTPNELLKKAAEIIVNACKGE